MLKNNSCQLKIKSEFDVNKFIEFSTENFKKNFG
jgi:hypothetical protein